jgi:hypothetical protein
MKMRFLSTVLLLISGVLFTRCGEKITGEANPNQPPETTIFVQGDSLNTTQSIQTFHWDGRDPDGFVVGFYYTFSETPQPEDWVFTTKRSETFALSILGADTTYTFQVKAVDNQGLEDPTPAVQRFPIVNTRPQVAWAPNSRIPDTTLTVASFAWSATDPDGDETIEFIEYALDDTSNWIQLPGDIRSVDLKAADGLTEGEHVFYLRAVDIAGARSSSIRMPESPNNTWYVKLPKGRYLLIDDYQVESNASGRPDAYYRGMLNNLLPTLGEDYTYWNIESQFPASPRQFSETLKLFDRVIWYTDIVQNSDPHFIYAQTAIPEFRQNGGKIIYTVQFNSSFGTQGDPLGFTPVDSLGKRFNFIATNSQFYPDSLFADVFPTLPPLPELKVSTFILGGAFAFRAAPGAVPMYRFDEPNVENDPLFVVLGRNDNTGEFDFVFSGAPLHMLRGNNNLDQLFEIILTGLFQ